MFSPPLKEVVRFLRFGFAGVHENESLSLRESRALRPGEGLLLGWRIWLYAAKKTLPGRYRVRPSRKREGYANPFSPET